MRIKINSYILRRFSVPRRSNPELSRIVELWDDKSLTCDCPAGMFRHRCHHQTKVLNFLHKEKIEEHGKKKKKGNKTNSGSKAKHEDNAS